MHPQSLNYIQYINLDIQLSLSILPQPVLPLVPSPATAAPLGTETSLDPPLIVLIRKDVPLDDGFIHSIFGIRLSLIYRGELIVFFLVAYVIFWLGRIYLLNHWVIHTMLLKAPNQQASKPQYKGHITTKLLQHFVESIAGRLIWVVNLRLNKFNGEGRVYMSDIDSAGIFNI